MNRTTLGQVVAMLHDSAQFLADRDSRRLRETLRQRFPKLGNREIETMLGERYGPFRLSTIQIGGPTAERAKKVSELIADLRSVLDSFAPIGDQPLDTELRARVEQTRDLHYIAWLANQFVMSCMFKGHPQDQLEKDAKILLRVIKEYFEFVMSIEDSTKIPAIQRSATRVAQLLKELGED